MKNMRFFAFILAFFLCACAHAQNAYIECGGDVFLVDGAIDQYKSPNILVDARYSTNSLRWTATLSVLDAGLSVDSAPSVKTQEIQFSDSEIDSYTASGSTNSEKIKNAILQAVKDYLEGINVGITFTLH